MMRNVTRLTIVLVMAAIAAMSIDVSPAYARRGGGPGRGGPSGPSASRGGGHHSPAPAAARSGANPRLSGPHHGPQSLGSPQPSHAQQQAAQQWRQHSAQWRQNQAAHANWQGRGQARQSAQAWWNNYQNGPQPFTPAWYAQHPNAWHVTHPYADEWAVVSAAAVAGWLGWAYAPQPSYSSTTIIYEDAPDETEQSETLAQVYVDASPSDVPLPPGDWLPLGVYSLVAAPNQPPMQLVQLSVDRQGVIRGVYYDAMTNTSHNVVGALDRDTQQAQWTLQSNPSLAFRAGLDQLTQPEGVVEVSLPGGGVEQWHLVRMENTSQ